MARNDQRMAEPSTSSITLISCSVTTSIGISWSTTTENSTAIFSVVTRDGGFLDIHPSVSKEYSFELSDNKFFIPEFTVTCALRLSETDYTLFNILIPTFPITNIDTETVSHVLSYADFKGISTLKNLFYSHPEYFPPIMSFHAEDMMPLMSAIGAINPNFFTNTNLTIFVPTTHQISVNKSDIPTKTNSVLYIPIQDNATVYLTLSYDDGKETTIIEKMYTGGRSYKLKVDGVLYKLGDPVLLGRDHAMAFIGFGGLAFTPDSRKMNIGEPVVSYTPTPKQIRAAITHPDQTMRMKAITGREIMRAKEKPNRQFSTSTPNTITCIEQGKAYIHATNRLQPPTPVSSIPTHGREVRLPDLSSIPDLSTNYDLSVNIVIADMANIDILTVTGADSLEYTENGVILIRGSVTLRTITFVASNCKGNSTIQREWGFQIG